MTPEQLKQKPFEEIFKIQHEEVDTDEGESTKVQEDFTTSEELTEEYSTFSDMSKQNSESDIRKHRKHYKFIICTTQQCMIKMI